MKWQERIIIDPSILVAQGWSAKVFLIDTKLFA